MLNCDYSIEELKAALQRSDAITLITEGSDDYTLLRGLGSKLGCADLLPVGGKSKVLILRQYRDTFSCPKSAFLVDRDLWLFKDAEVDTSGNGLVITDGYSIENDLLRDAKAECLINDDERDAYQNDLELVIQWYSSGVTARLNGMEFDFDRPIKKIIDVPSGLLTPEAALDVEIHKSTAELQAIIKADYQRLLRGKTWLRLLSKYTCSQGRPIQHSPMNMLDYGLRSGGEFSTNLITGLQVELI